MSHELESTFEQKRGPRPTDYDTYAEEAEERWQSLLNQDPKEEKVQDFLERNPSFVPGAWTPGMKSGHAPHNLALITQPRLTDLEGSIPDFMWISKHSLAWYPTLIEIERPGKEIFLDKGTQPRSEFTQAENQLREWKTWFSIADNRSNIARDFGVSHLEHSESLQMKPYFVLIYGRRNEFRDSPKRSRHRASLLDDDDMELMSFDRIGPDPGLRDALTVRAKGYGEYKVVAIPPTFALSPLNAEVLLNVEGFEEALENESRISKERKDFILERIEYWREWASSGESGIIDSYYRE